MCSLPPLPILILDACILLPGTLRRLLLRLADAGCFRPAWSERIGDEWRRNAARVWGLEIDWFETEWIDLQQRFPQAMADRIDHFKEGLRYSDPKDWHVIAAARCMRQRHPDADVAIVTRNLKDFNRSELRRLGIGVTDPDTLLARWWPVHAPRILTALDGNALDTHAADWREGGIEDILLRERMFKLRGLIQAQGFLASVPPA